jgi:hypothetical protein
VFFFPLHEEEGETVIFPNAQTAKGFRPPKKYCRNRNARHAKRKRPQDARSPSLRGFATGRKRKTKHVILLRFIRFLGVFKLGVLGVLVVSQFRVVIISKLRVFGIVGVLGIV